VSAFDDGDKTEEATPGRLEEAREKGDVAVSREMASFIVYVGMALVIYFTARHMLKHSIEILKRYFDFNAHSLTSISEALQIGRMLTGDLLMMIGPFLGTVFVFGIAAYIGQFGFLFTTEKLQFDLDKINPQNGFKRIFSRDTAMELVKSILKLGMISGILYLVLRGEVDKLIQIGTQPVPQIFIFFVMLLAKVFMALLIFLAFLGILDFGFQKWSYAQKMKMSMQEVRDEYKQREGDPQVKARIRQIQRDRLRKQMMEKVPTADVVVTNPTHVAVALKYQKGLMKAPVVVAKGAGVFALRIKELAMQNNIPIVEKRELARFMYRFVEINDAIPESLYTAVAEVLAYVYRIKKKFKDWQKNPAASAGIRLGM